MKKKQILNKAIVAHQANELATAEKNYLEFLKSDSKNTVALGNLGALYSQIGNYTKAVEYLTRSLAFNDNEAGPWSNLGVAYKNLGDYEKAIKCQLEAIKLNDSKVLPDAYYNLGITYIENDQIDHGIQAFTKALVLDPNLSKAYNNRGLAFVSIREFDKAISDYNAGMAIEPDNPRWNWNLSLVYLLLENYEQGWPLYEYRQKLGHVDFDRTFSAPLWDGIAPLEGKTLLLFAEQGFGDCIQFCRYAILARQMGAQVILEVFSELVHVIASIGHGIKVVPLKKNVDHVDYYLPMLSAPLAFKTNKDSIPNLGKYLTCPSRKSLLWSLILGARKGPRIGIAWSGRVTHKHDKQRSIILKDFLAAFPAGVELHSLQKEYREYDLQTLKNSFEIYDHSDLIKEYSDTAAIIEQMDMVVTVDTSVAHLAGALGKPVWLLLANVPDWRWGINGDSTPWYNHMKLFRQSACGQWQDVFKAIYDQLQSTFRVPNSDIKEFNEIDSNVLTTDQHGHIHSIRLIDNHIQDLYQKIEIAKIARQSFYNELTKC